MAPLRSSIVTIVCFLCFPLMVQGQDEDETASRVELTVTPTGSFLRIRAEWAAYPDMRNSDKYQVSICEKGFDCATVIAKRGTTSYEFTSLRHLKLSFWSEYTINVRIAEQKTTTLWAKRQINTGPGPLPAVQNLLISGGQKSITVSWNAFSKNMQQKIDFYEVTICHSRVKICSPVEKVSPTANKHTMNGLTAGVKYRITVTVHKTFEEQEYRSLPVSKEGFTASPPVKQYPKVRNAKFTLQRNKFDCDILIEYDQPKVPSGKKFYGVLIEVFDYRGKRMIESTTSQADKPVIKGMPFFSKFEVRVHALYQEGGDLVESDSDFLEVKTGVGEIAKPVIAKLTSVNGSAALIQWTHEASQHSEYAYRLIFKDGPTVEIRDANDSYTLVGNLEADRKYTVTVTAFQQQPKKEYNSTSDEKQFTMLPKDALIPKMSAGRILGDELLLNCDVTLPAGDENLCSFEVSACLADGGACFNTTFESKPDQMWIPIKPFATHNIVVRTSCLYFDAVNVTAESAPLQVFTKTDLAPVSNIHTLVSDSSISVNWRVPLSQAGLYDGFKLSWGASGSETLVDQNVTGYSFEIENLQPATQYNIAIAGYKLYQNEILRSDTEFTSTTTSIPAPPEVEELVVEQIPYSSAIDVKWKAPAYSYGPLEYRLDLKCQSEKTIATSETSYRFNYDGMVEGQTECTVGVTPTARDSANQIVGTNTAWYTTNVKLMPRAEDCSVKFVEGFTYKATITAPPEVRDLDILEYRISDQLDRDGERVRNSSILIESRQLATTDHRRVQLCANDICGADFLCKFDTNTGEPGSVNQLHVALLDATTLHITWSKPSLTNGPIDGYRVEIRDDLAGDVKSVDRKGTETFYDFHSGEEYAKFTVMVRAFNLDRFISTADPKIGSEERSSIETKGTVPRAPEKLSVGYVDGQQTLSWKPKFDPTFVLKSYKIVAIERSSLNRSELSSAIPQLCLLSLTPFTEYRVEISSCLDEASTRCGKPSVQELKTDVGHPNKPSVALVGQNETDVEIRWSAPTEKAGPIDGYEVAAVESDSSLSPSNWSDVGGEVQSFVLHDLQPGTAYVVHVRAFNEDRSGTRLPSPVGVLNIQTQGVSNGIGAPWIAVLCCLAAGTIVAVGFIVFKKLNPNRNLDLRNLIFGRRRAEPATEIAYQDL